MPSWQRCCLLRQLLPPLSWPPHSGATTVTVFGRAAASGACANRARRGAMTFRTMTFSGRLLLAGSPGLFDRRRVARQSAGQGLLGLTLGSLYGGRPALRRVSESYPCTSLASRITASLYDRRVGAAPPGGSLQILTVRVAHGRIHGAPRGQGGLNGAVGAGRYGDTAQSGKLALQCKATRQISLGFFGCLRGVLSQRHNLHDRS